ncbi:hypothetical protein pb186bvf_011222 [Paramecium bursaria]
MITILSKIILKLICINQDFEIIQQIKMQAFDEIINPYIHIRPSNRIPLQIMDLKHMEQINKFDQFFFQNYQNQRMMSIIAIQHTEQY